MNLSELRAEVFERDGGCVWPSCTLDTSNNPLQLAHLQHRGMGGSQSRNTADNLGTLRYELNAMLRHVAGLT